MKIYNFLDYIKENKFNIIDFVTKKHGSQKYGDKPYIYHILGVNAVCDRFINKYEWSEYDKDVIKKSIMCHDLLEDTDTTKEELISLFGEDVYKVVFNVSGFGNNRKERNTNAYSKIPNDDRSIFVKLCDRISNVEESIGNDRLFNMYRSENDNFKKNIFNGKFLEMWGRLDELFNNP